MPLTRPKIWDLDTNVEYFMDPITVLHQGSTQANVDVGFLFNRANGLVSNVAVYWSESANTFVTAFTNNSGVTNSNIVATGYANLTIGSLLSINGNIYLNGTAGIPGQYISSTASGTAWASSSFNGGVISNTLFPSGNLTLNLGTTSAFWANTYTGNVILSNNILWANGTVFSSGTGSGSVGYSPSANVAIYANVTPYTTNQTFYPVFSNITTAGNSVHGVSSSLSYNPSTGALTATSFSGTLSAVNVAGTTATANAVIYTGITNTASGTYYPVLSSQNTTGNTQAAVNSSLSYNAATGNVSATAFVGSGQYLTGITVAGTVATANVALYEQVQNYTTGTFYPTFSNTSITAGNTVIGVNSSLSYNATTGTLSATNLSGTLQTAAQTNITSVGTLTSLAVGAVTSSGTIIASTVNAATIGNSGASLVGTLGAVNVAGTVATANVALYASATPYTTTANFYPVFSNTVTAGNTTSGVATNMVFNPGTGNLYVNNIVGSGQYLTSVTATVSGTVATANVALYESVTAYTTNQTFYPVFSNISTTGNTTSGVSANLSFNPATGNLIANIVTTTGNLIIGGNTIHNSKTYFNFSGDEQIISQDTSVMRTGSWSVTASGSLYTLAGEPLMWYWIHNCAIDPATGNFLARDDYGPVTVWALTESMLIKTWISPPDQILSVPSSWTLTGNQDTNNGLFTTGGMSGNSLKLTQVTTPAAAVGTGSTTGGSLAAGNYYVRVVGIDVNGQATLPSPESTVVTTTGSSGSINYVIPATIGVNNYRIYVTQTSGTYNSGYFTFNPDYLTNYFTLTTLTGTTAGTLPSINNTGGVNITGNLTVLNTGGTSNSISGNIGINTTLPDTELTILGIPQTVVYPVTGVNQTLGTDLHIVGADGATPTRITQDTFGTGSYIAFTGRAARGTAASPAQSLSGDTLTQLTARGFSSGSLGFGTASTGRVDIVAAENFTDTSRATNVVIFTTAVGAINPTATATFSSATGLAVTGNTAISGNLTTNGGLLVPVLGLSIVSAQGWNLA